MNETSKSLQRCERGNPIEMRWVNKNIDRRSKTGKLKKSSWFEKKERRGNQRRKTILIYSSPFSSSICEKAKQISHVRRSRKGQPELGKNIQGKTSIDRKMAKRITIDRKLPIKATANPQKLSSRQLPSDHLNIRNSPSKSQSSSVLREFSSRQLPSDHLNIRNSPSKSQSSSVLREFSSRQLPSDHLNIQNSPSKSQSSPVSTLLTIIRN